MRYELEGLVSLFSERHRLDTDGIGCACGFCVWSPQHVAVMAYRDAIDHAEWEAKS